MLAGQFRLLDIVLDKWRMVESFLGPEEPGVGVELNHKIVAKYRIR